MRRWASEKEFCIFLMSMQNNKSPGTDGLTKEVFVTFGKI